MSDDDALLTTKDIAERYGIHKLSVSQFVRDGRIPKPVEGWTGASKRWLKSEIVAHMRSLRKQELQEQR